MQILSQRLARKARDGASFLGAAAGFNEQRHVEDTVTVAMSPKEGQWPQALNDTFGILADAIATLPSQDEIDQVTAFGGGRAAIERRRCRDDACPRPTPTSWINAVGSGSIVEEPGFMLELFQRQRKILTPENVGAAMRTAIQGDARAMLLDSVPIEGGNAAFAAALTQARATKAAARTEEKHVSLDDLGRPGVPGKVVSRYDDRRSGRDPRQVRQWRRGRPAPQQ